VMLILFLATLAAGFAEFGATTSLNDVARHFGHFTQSNTIQSVVGLSGSALGLGLAAYRLSSLAALHSRHWPTAGDARECCAWHSCGALDHRAGVT